MRALLGKITNIVKNEETGLFDIKFRALCTLPDRDVPPEWLKDQTLTIDRPILDERELGRPGDSIVLTPEESARWLNPLVVEPDIVYGKLPDKLRLRLRWWKDENAPDFTVSANSRLKTEKFTKDGNEYSADIETKTFFDAAPQLPVSLGVSCDKLKAVCNVLPDSEPFCRKLMLPQGERHRIENDWYAIDIDPIKNGSGIASLREKNREVDHFNLPQNIIQAPFEYAGHTDCLDFASDWGEWGDKLGNIKASSSGARREGKTTRFQLDGVVDEGLNLTTSVSYTVHDEIPLITIERDYYFHPAKKKEDDKGKEEKHKEPIDDSNAVRLGFRGVWIDERDKCNGSRLVFVDGKRLAAVRLVQYGEYAYSRNWHISHGCVIVQHPLRRECMMYLFDPDPKPQPIWCFNGISMVLDVKWPAQITKPGISIGRNLALSAGEICGASPDGAWIACRTNVNNIVKCAVIARLWNGLENTTAAFQLGDTRCEEKLDRILTPGIGEILYATAEFDDTSKDALFDVSVAGIESRR